MRLTPDGARFLAGILDDALVGFAGFVSRLKERCVSESGISRLDALLDEGDEGPGVRREVVTTEAVEVPAEFAAPTTRCAYRRGYLGTDESCPYRGPKVAAAWAAGRRASGRPVPVEPRPAAGDDVPYDVPPYAREAYLAGRAASPSASNPHAYIRGRSGGRHRAWARGREDAS